MVKDIVARMGVSPLGFRFYLYKRHAGLVRERSRLLGGSVAGGAARRSRAVAAKYAAIDSLRRLPRPAVRVAVAFALNPEAFRSYLYAHEPGPAAFHGRVRTADGHLSVAEVDGKYAEAVRLNVTTAGCQRTVAARLGMVYSSVGGNIRRYHPDVIGRHPAMVEAAADA